MTVAELIALLSQLDPSAQVVQSKHDGDNGISPTSAYATGFYRPRIEADGRVCTYAGEFRSELTDEERETGLHDEYEPEPHDVAAVCLWPTY